MAFPQVRGTPVNTVTPLSTTAAQTIDLPSGIQDGEKLLLITNAVSHAMWRVVCAFIVALLAALMLTQKPADAQQIKVDCKVYATNYVDPIALAPHLHHQIGNTSTTNSSTGDSLFNNPTTPCEEPWFTSVGWFPVERFESVKASTSTTAPAATRRR